MGASSTDNGHSKLNIKEIIGVVVTLGGFFFGMYHHFDEEIDQFENSVGGQIYDLNTRISRLEETLKIQELNKKISELEMKLDSKEAPE